MSLGLPEITTSPPSYGPASYGPFSPMGSYSPSPLAYFRGCRVVVQTGRLEQRLRHSFVLHVKLGDATLRTGLLRASAADNGFTVNYVMTFRYSGEQALGMFTRLDGVPMTSKLAAGVVSLRGASPDRSTIQLAMRLAGPSGGLWGEVNVLIELTDYELDLRSSPAEAELTRQATLNPTPSMHYIPTPSDPFSRQPSDFSRSRLRDPPSSRRSVVSNAPSQYDKIAAPTPYNGVKLIVLHGGGWKAHHKENLYVNVGCGSTAIAAKDPVTVSNDGTFVMNVIFQHKFTNDRLLHLAVYRSETDMVAQAICDTLYLMECGVVTCKQYLSFYSRFGTLEGHMAVITEFLTDAPKCGVFRFDSANVQSQLSPMNQIPYTPFETSLRPRPPSKANEAAAEDASNSTHSRTPPPEQARLLALRSPTTLVAQQSSLEASSPSGYNTTLALPQSGHHTALALPQSGFNTTLALPQSGYNTTTGTPQSGYDTTLALPQSGYDTTLALPQSGYDTTLALPQSSYDTTTGIPQSGYDPKLALPQSGYTTTAASPQAGLNTTAASPQSGFNTPSASYKTEVFPFQTAYRSLLCAVWSIRDLPAEFKSCNASMAIGQFVAAGQGRLSVSEGEARVRKVFSMPYANQRFVELRVLVDIGAIQCLRGSAWIDLESACQRGQTGLTEVEVRTVSENEYVGVVGVWLELSRREYPLGTKAFPVSPQWGDSVLPPSSLLVIAQGEESSQSSSSRPDRHTMGSQSGMRRAASPSGVSRMCSTSPRSRASSPLGMCGSPRASFGWTLPTLSERLISSKKFRDQCARSLPPVDSSTLNDNLAAKLDQVKSIEFQIHALRNLPDSYRCQTMKLIFLVKSSEEIICSQGIRINSLNPDFQSPVLLSVPFRRQDTLQIDILEVSVPLKPITLGRIHWNLSAALTSNAKPFKGILKILRHDSKDDHFYQRPLKDIFCLYSATFSQETSTKSFYLPEPLSSTAEEPLDWQPDELVVDRRHRHTYTPDPRASVSNSSLCVTIGEIKGLVIPSLPFEKQSLILALNVGGRHIKSNKITVERLQCVYLDTRFFLPVPPSNELDLHFQILSSTPVTPITVAAEGKLKVADVDATGDEEEWMVEMTCEPPHKAEMRVYTELIGRPTRVPLLAQMSSPTSVRGGRFF